MTSADAPALEPLAVQRIVRLGGLELLDQMIALLEEHGPERLGTAREALETGSLEAVQRAAHSLKSSAGNLGLAALQQAADAVETAAGAGDRPAVEAGVPRMEERFASGLAALRAFRSSMRDDERDARA